MLSTLMKLQRKLDIMGKEIVNFRRIIETVKKNRISRTENYSMKF